MDEQLQIPEQVSPTVIGSFNKNPTPAVAEKPVAPVVAPVVPTTPVAAVEEGESDISSRIGEALAGGAKLGQVKDYLRANMGMSEDDADSAVVGTISSRYKKAVEAGYNREAAKDMLLNAGFDPEVAERGYKASKIDERYKDLDFKPNKNEVQAQDIVGLYEKVHSKYSTTGKQVMGWWDENKAREARQEVNNLNNSIVERLKQDNFNASIDPTSGDIVITDENGDSKVVNSTMLGDLYKSKFEIAGSIAGAAAGFELGMKIPGNAWVKGTAAVLGAVGGGIIGSSGGKGLDVISAAIDLKENIDSELVMSQMAEAGIADATFGVVGSVGMQAAKTIGKAGLKAWSMVAKGNVEGARRAFLEGNVISPEQADDIVDNYKRMFDIKTTDSLKNAKGEALNKAEEQLYVLSQTVKGGELAVQSAANNNSRVSAMIKRRVDDTAKNFQAAVNNSADENVGSTIRKELGKYEKDVKDYYGAVKQSGADVINGTDFRFDLDKLAIKPVVESIERSISNPKTKEQFLAHAQRIESASRDRTFGGLVELRQAVNEFKYTKDLNPPEIKMIDNVIGRIDGQISKAARDYLPEKGKLWMNEFRNAKTEYAKMKVFQNNEMYKAVSRKSATEQNIEQVISKYGNSKDVDVAVFNPVMERLTPATQVKVETAAINNLTKKYTVGTQAEYQAIDFPSLAADLNKLNIKSPQSKAIVDLANDLGKLFNNDKGLAGLYSTGIKQPSGSILSNNPASALKMGIFRAMWNNTQKYFPTKGGRNVAMIVQLEKLLAEPLHAPTAEQFIRMMPKEAQGEMRSLVKEYQIRAAAEGARQASANQDFVKMYKQSKGGELTVGDGAFGKGVYLVNKVTNPNPEAKVASKMVNMTRLATLDDISTLMGRQVKETSIRNIRDLQTKLAKQGYLGVNINGKVMLFPETTVGIKTRGR